MTENRIDIQPFFTCLQRRINTSLTTEELQLDLYGYTVRLVFVGLTPPDVMVHNLGLFITPKTEKPDETVFIWEDDLDTVMQESIKEEYHWRKGYYQGKDYHVRKPGITRRLAARNNNERITYVCFDHSSIWPIIYLNKPFVNEMQWWLWDRFYLLHGAVLGLRGSGALITSPSGGGKSTLALSGILEGLEYVSEDYVLISREGIPQAYPIFQTGYLVPQSLDMLPEYREHVLLYSPEKNKYLIDLSPWKAQFYSGMKLKMIIYPKIADMQEPEIIPARDPHLFVEALTSTVKQIKSRQQFTESFLPIFQRLNKLPGAEFLLSKDTRSNSKVLKKYMEEKF